MQKAWESEMPPDTDLDFNAEVRQTFLEYRRQHEMKISRCFYEDHDYANPIIFINERVNLCGDLPLFAMTCRQVLRELWGLIFCQKAVKPVVCVKVRDLDFFPGLRFIKILNSHNVMYVDGNTVFMELRRVVPNQLNTESEISNYERRYTQLRS
jgi:hypothetical protein